MVHSRRRADDGFGIAEVMVALLLFAMVSMGTLYAITSMLQITRDARNRQVAANLAAQEIDRVRAAADVLSVADNSYSSTQNGTTFHLARSSAWVPAPGDTTAGPCGTSGGPQGLRLKQIVVTVTWDGMRPTSPPVTSNTVLNPRDRLVDEKKGTILVTVVGRTAPLVQGWRCP
ncbi:MAG: hypothetical protein FWD11_05705 [Micrococcales bacterium]|nr:hypothetical protein [Micrococcales bacterium]